MIGFDYHVHTHFCGHARGTMEDMVRYAISVGLEEIGFADHLPLMYTDDRLRSMARTQLPVYVDEVLKLKEVFSGQINVRLGIEADYYPPSMDEIERMLAEHPFEYVIGSIHYLCDWMFDDPRHVERFKEIDLNSFYEEYLESLVGMIKTGLFDVVAHPDLVKKFGHRPSIDLKPYYREILLAIKEGGLCYEVNTAGLRWPANEVYPEPAFIRLGAELDVPVTLGSDAHCPEDIGRDFDLALNLLLESGYREVAVLGNGSWNRIPILMSSK